MIRIMLAVAMVSGMILSACSVSRSAESRIVEQKTGVGNQPAAAVKKARIYRMSGNYSANVAIEVGDDGRLISYPAPGDITAGSAPVPLAGGYWLDRRGVTLQSRFTTYSIDTYRTLTDIPSHGDLLRSVIPGAVVVEVVDLPLNATDAVADTAVVNRLIRTGRIGAVPVLSPLPD